MNADDPRAVVTARKQVRREYSDATDPLDVIDEMLTCRDDECPALVATGDAWGGWIVRLRCSYDGCRAQGDGWLFVVDVTVEGKSVGYGDVCGRSRNAACRALHECVETFRARIPDEARVWLNDLLARVVIERADDVAATDPIARMLLDTERMRR